MINILYFKKIFPSQNFWRGLLIALLCVNPLAASEFEIDVSHELETVPSCDCWIDDNSDWTDELNRPECRVNCVVPGDYSNAGRISLTANGTQLSPRILKLKVSPNTDSHPVAEPNDNNRAIIKGFIIDGADYWIIDRLTVRDEESIINNGATNNVLNRLLFENPGNNNSMLRVGDGSHSNTIQNSVLRNGPYTDNPCFELTNVYESNSYTTITDTKFVQNEVYNCADGLQLVSSRSARHGATGKGQDDYSGTIIDDNDIYLTDAYYSDCNNNLSPTGECSFAENAIDIKAGAWDATNPVKITNNRIWGWYKTDPNCSPPNCEGLDSWGEGVVIHFYGSTNINVSNNVIWSSNRGIAISDDPGTGNSINYNIVADTSHISLLAYGTGQLLRGNVIVDNATPNKWLSNYATDSTLECNSVYKGNTATGGYQSNFNRSYNRYWMTSTLDYPGVSDEDDDSQPATSAHCVFRKMHTSLENYCLDELIVDDYTYVANECEEVEREIKRISWSSKEQSNSNNWATSSGFDDRAIRILMHTDHVYKSGRKVRLTFRGRPNESYDIRDVSLILSDDLASNGTSAGTWDGDDATHTFLTFDNNSSVTVPAGSTVVSDWVDFNIVAGDEVFGSFYVEDGDGMAYWSGSSGPIASCMTYPGTSNDRSADADWGSSCPYEKTYIPYLYSLEVSP